MKITASDYMDLIENEKYETKAVAIKDKEFENKINSEIKKAATFGDDSLNSGKLFEYQINVGNTVFLIQSGIINLPFQDYKKVTHFFDDDEEIETKIYLVTKSEFINKSKLRIEKVSDDSEIDSKVQELIVDFMKKQLSAIKENESESDDIK
ncbi:hypothetical protein [Companilactobacillus sp. DQM5]|uniref:hypothetical protein n=1 Tax=Companilactobacillus sp. DQM5 TaxID=3463359 RepID=UPI004059E59B